MKQIATLDRAGSSMISMSLPRLRPAELKAAVEFKLHGASPVPLDNMQRWYFTHRTKDGWRVWVFLIFDTRQTDKVTNLDSGMPLVLPRALGPKVTIALLTKEGIVLLEYRDSFLERKSLPLSSLEDLQKAGEGEGGLYSLVWDSPEVWPSKLPAKFIPLEGPIWKRPRLTCLLVDGLQPRRTWIGPSLVASLGLICLLLASFWWLQAKVERNREWREWVSSSRPPRIALAESQWKSWLDAAGTPLPEILEKLSRLWSEGVTLTALKANGQKLSLEGTASSGLSAWRALVVDPLFHGLVLTSIRPRNNGPEEFFIEGEVDLEP